MSMSQPSAEAWVARLGRWLVLAALSASSGAHAQTSTTRPPQRFEALGRDILSELVAINSTHAHGSTVAAQAVAARALAAGFPPADVNVLAPADDPDKGNVVVRLRGRPGDRPVLYIAHLDVVEAPREDWTFDPFRLTEQEGWLYGRGTIDMKGQDAAVLTSLIRLKQEGVVPARDIIAAFTADEEAGGDANGVAWLFKEHRDLVDAALIVNPDGGEAGIKQGRKLYVAVQTSEKVFVTFALETTDKGGHSSRPTADNPIYRLAAGLDRLAKLPEMSPGASDSIYTRAVGLPSYGIDGMFDDLDDGRAHGRDERIGVVAFAEELEFTYCLMRAICDAPSRTR
jgi:acetylornithine deacetylase/succinyl-diaminopimelate desuccinylase-like protein